MSTPHGRRTGSTTRRRWRIPPPLVQEASGPGPEGLSVLEEFCDELGMVLWSSLRSVLFWSAAPPASRRNLFPPDLADRRAAEILAVIPDDTVGPRGALEDLLAVVARPERVDPAFVGLACHRVATWADGRGARRTQLEYLQAAALACPANAGHALAVGSACRDLTQYARAEGWYFRAIGLARQANDWEAYVKAYLNHGIMMFRRGALPAARRSFIKAVRRSRRQGLREGEAKALHELSAVEHRSGNFVQAIACTDQAFDAYGPEHPNLPRLAHDVAYYWLEQGDFDHALPVFMATLGRVRESERATVLGSLARAAAGAGDTAAHDWSHRELLACPAGPGVAEAWVDMARAALLLDRVEAAREAAGIAESMARDRREGQIRFLAEEILREAERERTVREEVGPYVPEPSTRNDALARKLLRSLQFDSTGARPVRV